MGQIVFTKSGSVRMTTTKQYDDLNRLTQISSAPGGAGTIGAHPEVVGRWAGAPAWRTACGFVPRGGTRDSRLGSCGYKGGARDFEVHQDAVAPEPLCGAGAEQFQYDLDGNLISDGRWTHLGC